MKRVLLRFAGVMFATALVGAQSIGNVVPTLTSFNPTYGGVGGNAAGTWTITGTGFSTALKGTRFVDTLGNDVFQGVSCSTSTSCTASLRPNRVPAGSIANIPVHAFTVGGNSNNVNFLYYGAPIVTSLSPNTGPYNASTAYNINGGGFSAGASFPGTTSVYLFTSIVDHASGCGTTSVCAATAPALSGDCCAPMGARQVTVITPGGSAFPYFFYGNTPNTPTITSVSPAFGPSGGGNTVTITGTNFITGTNSAGGAFGVTLGTTFAFNSNNGFSAVNATGVNCSSTTTCTAVVPNGTGLADIQVFTVCGINSAAAGCGGTNARPSVSVQTTKTAAYQYSGIKTTPAPGLFGSGPSLYTSENGLQASFTVALNTQPTAAVHVAVGVSPAGIASTSASGLDFTTLNWATPQTITVTGLDDGGTVSGNAGYNVTLLSTSTDANYNNVNGGPPGFINIDNDSKLFEITPQAGLVTTRAGGTATFTVVLSKAPINTVTVNLVSNDTSEGTVSPALLTFTTTPNGATGWNTPRTITVTGVNDGTPGVAKPYQILVTAASVDAAYGDTVSIPDVSVTNQDAPPTAAPAITVNPVGSTTVLTGGVLFFSANASGIPLPTAQWQVSTTGGASWSDIPGATSYNLSFAAQRFDNGKKYRAVFTNASGTATTANASLAVRLRVRSDIDNDRKADLVIWRPSNGTWFWLTSVSGFNYAAQGQKQWGNLANNDVPISADMDGDGIMDLVVWRANDATFYWLTSSTGYNYASAQSKQWGNNALGDKPFVGDIDGDGKGDLIVWRPGTGTWFYLFSSNNYNYAAQGQKQWGNAGLGDQPMLGDFDGDGLVNLTVWRASTGDWFWLKSTLSYDQNQPGNKQWGNSGLGDIPLVGDLDGDGVSDLTVWRPTDSTFYYLTSLSGYNYAAQGQKQWGASAQSDIPMLGDIDGDGGADLIVWRPAVGTWFWLTSSSGYSYAAQGQKQWGSSTDIPMIR